MQLSIDQKDIEKFMMVGDRVLIKPKNPQKTKPDQDYTFHPQYRKVIKYKVVTS